MTGNMNREDIIKNFVKAQGWNVADLTFLAGDASHRKYYRLKSSGGFSLVIMDAPPTHEDAGVFKSTTEVLQGLGLSSPRILKEDLTQGILVLEDFGNQTYTHCLKNNSVEEETLYRLAVDVLITLYQKVDSHAQVPAFSADNLFRQVNLLMEWYVPAIFKDKKISGEMEATWKKIWMEYLKPLESERKTMVLWDYHVDNLMWLPDRQGVQRCGLLDFQDAVIGPYPYDLVSLLEDARRDVPRELQEKND
jgi:aminoglycoside/choline kinase family phosphotransferase